jgi:hypothetical protein
MKNKGILFFTGLILSLIFISFFIYRHVKLESIKNESAIIDNNWKKIYYLRNQRNSLIIKLVKSNGYSDSILAWKYLNKKLEITQIDSLWENEYNLNELVIEMTSKNKSESKNNKIIKTIENLNIELNAKLNEYNSRVLMYNKIYSTFPIFIFAKNVGLRRKKFFNLKYGETNTKLLEVKKKNNKWIESGSWK